MDEAEKGSPSEHAVGGRHLSRRALLLFLDTAEERPLPEETFVWVLTKSNVRWVRSDLGTAALKLDVQALRCGLDDELWENKAKRERCIELLKAHRGDGG